jgi:hypothetical protein
MSKYRTPAKWRRRQAGVPSNNHEVTRLSTLAWWGCCSCDFAGNFCEATTHIIANQFEPEEARGRVSV